MSLLSPRLQLKVSQKQILTPGLVQMVTVLQLNRLELKEMITQEIVKNPVLEEATEEAGEEITPEELMPLLEAEQDTTDPADKQTPRSLVLNDANSLEGSVGDVAINGNLFPDAEETASAVSEPEVPTASDPALETRRPRTRSTKSISARSSTTTSIRGTARRLRNRWRNPPSRRSFRRPSPWATICARN